MLCNFQLKVQQFYLKLTYEKGFIWHTRGQSTLYLLCDINGDVQYFCRMKGDKAKVLFDFYKQKNCTCLVNKVLVLISTCCHYSVVKIILNFWALITTALPLSHQAGLKSRSAGGVKPQTKAITHNCQFRRPQSVR